MRISDWSSDVCSSDLIAGSCREVFIVARQNARSFVEKIGFVTSFGHGAGGSNRQDIGLRTKGPTLIVTDLCRSEERRGGKECVNTFRSTWSPYPQTQKTHTTRYSTPSYYTHTTHHTQ